MSATAARPQAGTTHAVVRSIVRGLTRVSPLGALIMFGAGLRLYDLGAENYWVDEVTTLRASALDIGSILTGPRPPLYVLLSHFWFQFFGTSEATTRLMPAIFGGLCLPLIFMVGRDLFDKRVGLTAAFLASISAYQIYYSQEIRYYSLFTLLALASYLCAWRALTTGRRLYFVLYAASSILMYFSHSFAVFVLAAQDLFFVLCWARRGSFLNLLPRRLLRWWGASQVVVGLAILPSVLLPLTKVVTGTARVMNWIPRPPLWQPFFDMTGYVLPIYNASKIAIAVVPVLAVATVLAVVVSRGGRRWWADLRETIATTKRSAASNVDKLLLLGCWLVLPVFAPFAMSYVFGPIYLARYSISATPALYILIAVAILSVRKLLPVYASLALVLAMVVPGLADYYVRPIKAEWEQATVYVKHNLRPGDVLLAGYESGLVISWYDKQGQILTCIPDEQFATVMSQNEQVRAAVISWATRNPRMWVATSLGGADPYVRLFSSGEVPGLALVDHREFVKASLYLFSRTAP